jgi:hypothetical protein
MFEAGLQLKLRRKRINPMFTGKLSRAALLTATVLTLATAAQAGNFITTKASGYWRVQQGVNDHGVNVCMMSTNVPALGETFAVMVNAADQDLDVGVEKNTWKIPTGADVRLMLKIDGGQEWRTTKANTYASDVLYTTINPSAARQFVHEFTSGSMLRVFFTGNEQPWTLSLNGTTGVWDAFMNCAQMIAPKMVASLNPSQPFSAGPVAPVAPPAPTTQPFSTGPVAPTGPAAPREFGA